MRKNLFPIFAWMLLAVACGKETPDAGTVPVGEGETLVRLQGTIGVSSKVEFDDTYGMFTWSDSGDEMAIHVSDGVRGDKVFINGGYKTASVVPNADPATCDFFFVMSEAQTRDFYAVYPASVADADNYGKDVLKITLPSEYEIAPEGMGNWAPTPMVAVNDPASDRLIFKHVGGLLRLTLNDVSPATEVITVSLGKRLSGSFEVNDPDQPVPYIVTDDAADELSFRLTGTLSDYADEFILNIPVPTGTYESLTVKAKNGSGDVVFSYEDKDVRTFASGRGRHAQTVISAVAIPLTLEALEDGVVVNITNAMELTFEYSLDNATWTSSSEPMIYIPLEKGECVYLRGNNAKYSKLHLVQESSGSYYPDGDFTATAISSEGQCYVYGNVMSLIDAENFVDCKEFTEEFALAFVFANAGDLVSHPEKSLELPATTLTPGCYCGLFYSCSGITQAPLLPATELKPWCYYWMFGFARSLTKAPEILADRIDTQSCTVMFQGCSSLTYSPDLVASSVDNYGCSSMFEDCTSLIAAPALPATELTGSYCYYGMFSGCSSLTVAPDLPALSPCDYCYDEMFKNCSSLENAPRILATSLGRSACREMFYGCTSLLTAPELPATMVGEYCYHDMFRGCTSLVTVPEILPATTLGEYCYYNMFSDCTSLLSAPELPATTLGRYCYQGMFKGCTSLVSAPEILPATTLTDGCYTYMFQDCTSLETAPVLPATSVSNSWTYERMFSGCSSLKYVKAMVLTYPSFYSWLSGVAPSGTFVMNAAAEWDLDTMPRSSSSIPEGWTVERATE